VLTPLPRRYIVQETSALPLPPLASSPAPPPRYAPDLRSPAAERAAAG
jgi:hypothetical protein